MHDDNSIIIYCSVEAFNDQADTNQCTYARVYVSLHILRNCEKLLS